MSNICYDIWLKIFSYLTPREQTKFRRINWLLYDVYLFYDINEEKHGFYEFVYDWRVLIYRFKLTKDKKDVWIKNGDKMEKRRLMRDKEGNYYCKGVKNVFLYQCELAKAEELHMMYCDICDNLNYYI
ncbi:5397_t:CDS:1, partial [Scutellospora calospora]